MEFQDLNDYFRNVAKQLQSPIDFRVLLWLIAFWLLTMKSRYGKS